MLGYRPCPDCAKSPPLPFGVSFSARFGTSRGGGLWITSVPASLNTTRPIGSGSVDMEAV